MASKTGLFKINEILHTFFRIAGKNRSDELCTAFSGGFPQYSRHTPGVDRHSSDAAGFAFPIFKDSKSCGGNFLHGAKERSHLAGSGNFSYLVRRLLGGFFESLQSLFIRPADGVRDLDGFASPVGLWAGNFGIDIFHDSFVHRPDFLSAVRFYGVEDRSVVQKTEGKL